EPPEGGASAPKVELVQAGILLLLVADVFPYGGFVSSNGRDEIASGPKMLPHEIAFSFSIDARQVGCALVLFEPDHLRHRILRWDRNHHVHMIRHQMAFLDPTFLLPRQLPEYLSKMFPQVTIQGFPSALGNENNVVFALPFRVA